MTSMILVEFLPPPLCQYPIHATSLTLVRNWLNPSPYSADFIYVWPPTLSKIRILFPRRLTLCMARRSSAFGSLPMNILHASAAAAGKTPLGKDDNFTGLSTREGSSFRKMLHSQPADIRPKEMSVRLRCAPNHNSLRTGVNMGSSRLRLAMTSSTSCLVRRVIS